MGAGDAGCYGIDNDTIGIGEQNIRGLEAIGNTAHGNGTNGFEFNNYDATLVQKLADCRVLANYAYDNDHNGIYFGNFIENNSAGSPIYGPADLDSYRIIIEGNICTANGFYGIAAQGDSLAVAGNTCASNAQAAAATGGVLFNANRSRCGGNLVINNLGFGIDAGGSLYSTVEGNQIYINNGTGLNVGASVNLKASGNHLIGNGGASGVQIEAYSVDTDAVFNAFPSLTASLSITGNHIALTSATQVGVFLRDGVEAPTVADNDFYGTVPLNYVVAVANRPIIRNNRWPVAVSRLIAPDGGGKLVVPDVFDFCHTNSATTLSSVDFHPAQSVVGRQGVAWVTLSSGGTGYTGPFTVTFTGGGGAGASGTACVRGGVVIGVRMDVYGSGYTSAPSPVFTAGGGAGAAGTAQVSVPLGDFRELEIYTLTGCTITRATVPVVESKAAADLTMTARDAVRLRSLFGQWNVLGRAAYGSTGPHVTPGMVITEAQADALLQRDLDRFEDAVAKAVPLSGQGRGAVCQGARSGGRGARCRCRDQHPQRGTGPCCYRNCARWRSCCCCCRSQLPAAAQARAGCRNSLLFVERGKWDFNSLHNSLRHFLEGCAVAQKFELRAMAFQPPKKKGSVQFRAGNKALEALVCGHWHGVDCHMPDRCSRAE